LLSVLIAEDMDLLRVAVRLEDEIDAVAQAARGDELIVAAPGWRRQMRCSFARTGPYKI
jgi:hypothetical protein